MNTFSLDRKELREGERREKCSVEGLAGDVRPADVEGLVESVVDWFVGDVESRRELSFNADAAGLPALQTVEGERLEVGEHLVHEERGLLGVRESAQVRNAQHTDVLAPPATSTARAVQRTERTGVVRPEPVAVEVGREVPTVAAELRCTFNASRERSNK